MTSLKIQHNSNTDVYDYIMSHPSPPLPPLDIFLSHSLYVSSNEPYRPPPTPTNPPPPSLSQFHLHSVYLVVLECFPSQFSECRPTNH